MMRITDAIRDVDKNHIIFVEGNWYATDFSDLTPPWDANMVYSFHKYWSENNHASIQAFINIMNKYNVPLWAGEFGENSNPWLYDCIKLFEDNQIGWCWWTYKKISSINCLFSAPISEKYRTVLNYWGGSGDQPADWFAQQALLEMVEQLKSSYCRQNEELLLPLFLRYSTSVSEPFNTHDIPGTIAAVDYDSGLPTIAYVDNEYQRTRWDVFQAWNIGWEYRNDGVDIERCKDSEGAGFNVGWMETAEWLMYSTTVNTPGYYEIACRVAAAMSGGKLLLSMNGQTIALLDIPNTGGWQNWQTVTAKSSRELTVGKGMLKVQVVHSGFNLNTIQFTALNTPIDEAAGRKESFMFVAPNYPNPFNDSTHIPVHVDQPALVRVDIYDVHGRHVRHLFAGKLNAGVHLIRWDGRDDHGVSVASGSYLCRSSLNGVNTSHSMLLLK